MTTKVEKNQINISSETAVSGGTTTSLVTTGEKYTWNNKQDSLPSQSGNSGKFLGTDGSNLSWQTVDALPSQTGQSGKYLTTDGTTASWAEVQGGGSVDIDNSTITTNSSDEIQTVGIKDARTDNTLKIWTGTKAQYDAISPKDSNTLYNVTDDISIQTAVLSAMFPVGSIYTAKTNTCPLEDMGIGTWQEITTSRILIAKKEATSSDKTWYNLYSDGYCEQGGMEPNDATTISLPLSFRDTLYNVLAMQNGSDGAYLNRAETISKKTVSNFYIDFKTLNPSGSGSFTYYDWIAVGYASVANYTIPKQWERIS